MFVRFSKRKGNSENEKRYRRAVSIGNTYLVQEGNNIIAFGRLKHNSFTEYIVWVIDCDHTTEIERYIKRFIGNSIKWDNPLLSRKNIRRKYKILYIGQEEINSFKFNIQWKET